MLIFSGFGFLVPIIAFLSFLVTQLLTTYFTGDDRYYTEHLWLQFVGSLLAGALIYGLSLLLPRLLKPRMVRDLETGEVITLHKSHTFFFIPVKWWALVVIFFGAVIMAEGPKEAEHATGQANEQSMESSEGGVREIADP